MSFRTTRARRASSFQFETLEDRSLLNAAIPASPTAQVHALKAVVLTQTVQGTLTGTFAAQDHTVSTSGNGILSSSHPGTVVGATAMTGQYKTSLNIKTLKLTITGGTATLTSGVGTINVKYTGSGKYANELTFTLKGTITGGTGQFKGATGTFSGTGTAPDSSAGWFQETVNATIKTKS